MHAATAPFVPSLHKSLHSPTCCCSNGTTRSTHAVGNQYFPSPSFALVLSCCSHDGMVLPFGCVQEINPTTESTRGIRARMIGSLDDVVSTPAKSTFRKFVHARIDTPKISSVTCLLPNTASRGACHSVVDASLTRVGQRTHHAAVAHSA
jgi:hypothetical protein